MENEIKLLSQKMSKNYHFTGNNYTKYCSPMTSIISAYNRALELFDVNSSNSIFTSTLSFYISHIDEAINSCFKDTDSLEATFTLLLSFINLQIILDEKTKALEESFLLELTTNKDYYSLFSLDYFLELTRSDGIDTALAELEEDVNIRANTYYNAAYKEYLEILPGFEEIIKKYATIA